MSVNEIFININGPPLDASTVESATVTFSATGTTSYSIGIFAQEVDALGAPVGSPESISEADATGVTIGGFSQPPAIMLDVSALDPARNYVFYAEDTLSGVRSSAVAVDVTCFATGTRILTAGGEVPVEQLRIGDLVVTMQSGPALRPVLWIGHGRVRVDRQPDPRRVAPILIRAGALADGVPHRDLRVSPNHAMSLDGGLVQARLLVNGGSIVQELWCRQVTYWHVELDRHALLVSEGAVSESYLDDGNRSFFDNHPVTMLVKDFAAYRANGRYRDAACAPVIEEGPALEAIRARIAQRWAMAGRGAVSA